MTLEWTVAVTFGSALRAVLRLGGCFGAMVRPTTLNNIRIFIATDNAHQHDYARISGWWGFHARSCVRPDDRGSL